MTDTEVGTVATQQTREVEQPQEFLERQETQAQDEVEATQAQDEIEATQAQDEIEATQAQAESTLTPLALKKQEIQQKEDEIASLQNQLTELNNSIDSLSKEEREQAYTPKTQQELVRAFYVNKTNNDLKEHILEIIESIKAYLPPAKISTKEKQQQIDSIKQQISQKQEAIDAIDEQISDDNQESNA